MGATGQYATIKISASLFTQSTLTSIDIRRVATRDMRVIGEHISIWRYRHSMERRDNDIKIKMLSMKR